MDAAGMEILEKNAGVSVSPDFSEEVLIREITNADAVVIRNMGKISRAVIENAGRLKVIGRHGAGFDNVDLQAATERGIPVVYTPEANTESVADHAMGMIIAIGKQIPQAHNAFRKTKNWSVRYEYIGTEIYNKTLGLVGLGRIGRSVVKRAKGFSMKILAYDPYVSEESARRLGVRLVNLETLLAGSDFVSVHVPLTKETYRLIGKREIEAMKTGSYLVNTSRGGIVDEKALSKALTEGKHAGAAIDVYEKEPPDLSDPLFTLENAITTPHMAAHTRDALRRMAVTVAKDVIRVLKGKTPRYVANPQVLPEKKIRKGR